MRNVKRKFATILASDCVGFSKHMVEDEEKTLDALNSCREIIDSFIEKHFGRIFHTAGDSVLAEFDSSVEAVTCAISFQEAMNSRNISLKNSMDRENRKLVWRVGIHSDDVIFENENVYGNGVNIAARLEAQCAPGQILVSRLVNDQVASRVEAIFRAAGTKKLKNITNEFEVFLISTDRTAYAELEKVVEKGEEFDRTLKPILSVLPFKNMNANEDSSFLVDGIYEDILTELSMVRQLSIVSRQSSVNFVDSNEDLDKFIEQFNVNFLIKGSARSSGNKVRVTVSLIQTENNEMIWSKKFDRSLDDIFEVQDEIVRSVTFAILGEIELASLSRAKRKPTNNMSSYEFLLKGKELHHQFNKEANVLAVQMFDSAIEADPENGQAYAWKACTIGQALGRGYIEKPINEFLPEFHNLMETALKLNPTDFECHRLLSAVYSMQGKMNKALEHGKKAFEMVPNDPRILQQYGEALLKTGKTKEGCELTLLALEYDPVAQGQSNSDKRKSDAVFACYLDERIDLGLEIARGIDQRNEQTLLFCAGLAISKNKSLKEFSWLLEDLRRADVYKLEESIEAIGTVDVVLQSSLREIYLDHIVPLLA